jgi:hypothetical protein
MIHDPRIVYALYKKLLALYPRAFKDRFGESMEQTFHDLWHEKRQTKQAWFSLVFWMFIDTAIGVCKEHLLRLSPGVCMHTIPKTLGSSALIGFLLVLPLMIMEVVTRRDLNEAFPTMLFFVLWLNLFAISLILLPIALNTQKANADMAKAAPGQKNTLLANPSLTMLISVALLLSPIILPLLDAAGWLSLDRLFNGSNPEVAYLPGQILSLVLIAFPVAAGVIAGRPIVNTLRAGGSLFAHPLHLIIVVVISFLFAAGVIGLIVDQWPCFIGVPNCD